MRTIRRAIGTYRRTIALDAMLGALARVKVMGAYLDVFDLPSATARAHFRELSCI